MQTDFFQCIAKMKIKSGITIAVNTGEQGIMTVDLQVENKRSKTVLPTLQFRGTPKEVDDQFLSTLLSPPCQATRQFNNIDSFISQLDEILNKPASPASSSNKPAASVKTVAKTPKQKKYEAIMAKVAEHEKNSKYRLAYGQLPKNNEFPEYKDAIEKKAKELMIKINEEGLFPRADHDKDDTITETHDEELEIIDDSDETKSDLEEHIENNDNHKDDEDRSESCELEFAFE